MPELNDLPEIDPNEVSEDDLLLIYDNSAVSSKARKVSRENLLKGVAREGSDANFENSEFETIRANSGTVVELSITTSLSFDAAATIEKVYRYNGEVITSVISAGSNEVATVAMTDVAVGDHVTISFSDALPHGLLAQAWVSSSGTVSIRFDNVSAGTISAASYTTNLVAMRFL